MRIREWVVDQVGRVETRLVVVLHQALHHLGQSPLVSFAFRKLTRFNGFVFVEADSSTYVNIHSIMLLYYIRYAVYIRSQHHDLTCGIQTPVYAVRQ